MLVFHRLVIPGSLLQGNFILLVNSYPGLLQEGNFILPAHFRNSSLGQRAISSSSSLFAEGNFILVAISVCRCRL